MMSKALVTGSCARSNNPEAEGRVHFVSSRPDKFSKWEIAEWTVKSYATGKEISLLEEDHAIPVPEETT
jgi:hypothetical protein